MLEKSAKISPNACAVVSLPDEHGHAENSYFFLYFVIFSSLTINNTKFFGRFAHVAPVKATAIRVEQPICTEPSPSGIKVQVCLPEQADKPALDVESLPCANGCSEVLKPNLAVWKCSVDQENGAQVKDR
ncbi:MAG: hypothetical protein Q4F24_03025 [Eubacteriales bacterium]|nr:hypothetical protein [Eubacteriales bacterium]